MKIGFVNKFFPPISSATGYHALQLAKFLKEKNHDISLFGSHSKTSPPIDQREYKYHLTKLTYNGKQKTLRLFFNFLDSFRLIWMARKSDQNINIILSDPPFLQFWATILLPENKTLFWFMDIFPDAFVANNLIRKSNIFNRFIEYKLSRFQPLGIITLGDQQAQYLIKYYPQTPKINLPIGIIANETITTLSPVPTWRSGPDIIYFCYAGNLGEAHDLDFIKCLIYALNPYKHSIIISCTGSKAQELNFWCADYSDRVHLVDHIPFEEYRYIDIHVVSLLKQWTHICVPSKAITALQHDGAILFNGSINSDTWKYVEKSAWSITPSENIEEKIKVLIESIDKKTVIIKKEHSLLSFRRLKRLLSEGHEEINNLLSN